MNTKGGLGHGGNAGCLEVPTEEDSGYWMIGAGAASRALERRWVRVKRATDDPEAPVVAG